MTAVTLFPTLLGGASGGERGRASERSAEDFGTALARAGRMMVEPGEPMPAVAENGVPAEQVPADAEPAAGDESTSLSASPLTPRPEIAAEALPVRTIPEPQSPSGPHTVPMTTGADGTADVASSGATAGPASLPSSSAPPAIPADSPVSQAAAARTLPTEPAAPAATPQPAAPSQSAAASSLAAPSSSVTGRGGSGDGGSPQPPGAAVLERSMPNASAATRAPSPASASGAAAPATGIAQVTPTPSTEGQRSPATAERSPGGSASTVSSPIAATTPAAPAVAPTPVSPAEPTANVPRAVAAQVAPVVINIAQRPAGTHQLTMTVNPDSLGPVTVRAHIAQNGDIQVQLSGATDAGRDALRTIVAELRRDLAAVSPHATLTIGSGAGAEAGTPDRGAQPGGGGAPGGRPSPGGESAEQQGRHGAPADGPSRDIPRIVPTTTRTGAGAGLDIFA